MRFTGFPGAGYVDGFKLEFTHRSRETVGPTCRRQRSHFDILILRRQGDFFFDVLHVSLIESIIEKRIIERTAAPLPQGRFAEIGHGDDRFQRQRCRKSSRLGGGNPAKPGEHLVLLAVEDFRVLLRLLADVLQSESFALRLNPAAQGNLGILRQPGVDPHGGDFPQVGMLAVLIGEFEC